MRDPAIELDVQLRRAALRMSRDEDAAAELARRVRARAAERGDAAMKLRASLELGQALLRARWESFGGAAIEIDLDGAEEAYRRAIELAEQLRDDRDLAAALREIGMIDFARGRAWFAGEVMGGRANELVAAVASRRRLRGPHPGDTGRPAVHQATQVLERALGIFERIGDRTGVMSTVIAMAYASYGPAMHLSNSARHLRGDPARDEPPVRARHRERAGRLDLQDALRGPRLLPCQGGARPRAVPARTLTEAAKLQGDRAIEFLAAGGWR
jgi:tetratricopeptide (TPR) repeat protein